MRVAQVASRQVFVDGYGCRTEIAPSKAYDCMRKCKIEKSILRIDAYTYLICSPNHTYNMIKQVWMLRLTLVSLLALFAVACQNDSDPEMTGNLTMKLTDAPADDAEISGVFITVVDVKVDGESYEGFSGRQTIDLTAYQNGQTYVLGGTELDASTYNNLSLVLDLDADADGNAPGCYVLKDDGQKVDLSGSATGTVDLDVARDFTIQANQETELVVDVDLRKAIRYADGDDRDEREYRFAPRNELSASLRAVVATEAGTIRGEFGSNTFSDPDRVIVYAYQAGEFDRDQEEQEEDDDVRFQGAITSSAAVKSGGEFSYQLNFVPEGEYELVLVALEEQENGSFEFEGFLQTDIALSGTILSAVEVNANSTTTFDLNITGLID